MGFVQVIASHPAHLTWRAPFISIYSQALRSVGDSQLRSGWRSSTRRRAVVWREERHPSFDVFYPVGEPSSGGGNGIYEVRVSTDMQGECPTAAHIAPRCAGDGTSKFLYIPLI